MSEAFDIRDILRAAGGRPHDLIGILQAVQDRFGHIPPPALTAIAKHVRLSPGEVFGVLSIYPRFSLRPPARHVCEVCLGTACHVRGGESVAEEIGRAWGVSPGQVTADGSVELKTVACLGCCAIGPVLRVDGRIEARLTPSSARSLAESLRAVGRKA
jgi:NADH:ubiquinone oxidoreductase subunit E